MVELRLKWGGDRRSQGESGKSWDSNQGPPVSNAHALSCTTLYEFSLQLLTTCGIVGCKGCWGEEMGHHLPPTGHSPLHDLDFP
jgi:hypothetical protein